MSRIARPNTKRPSMLVPGSWRRRLVGHVWPKIPSSPAAPASTGPSRTDFPSTACCTGKSKGRLPGIMRLRLPAALALLLACAGCATYREDLYRGQRLYEDNQYEKAL